MTQKLTRKFTYLLTWKLSDRFPKSSEDAAIAAAAFARLEFEHIEPNDLQKKAIAVIGQATIKAEFEKIVAEFGQKEEAIAS